MTTWKAIAPMGASPRWRVILLDRDGVVIKNRDYLGEPSGVQLIPGAADAMNRARQAGWLLVGVSNQSGLGRGYFSQQDLLLVMERLELLLAQDHAAFDGFYYCPHGPDAGCSCRKPEVGLIAEAGLTSHLDSRSWMIGDKVSDIELGQRLGIGSILVRTGYGSRSAAEVERRWSTSDAVHIVDDLAAAVDLILRSSS